MQSVALVWTFPAITNVQVVYTLVISHSYWKWPLIVDFSIEDGELPWLCESLPEGTSGHCNAFCTAKSLGYLETVPWEIAEDEVLASRVPMLEEFRWSHWDVSGKMMPGVSIPQKRLNVRNKNGHPFKFDGLHKPFMVNLEIVYDCLNHKKSKIWIVYDCLE